ncbi:hypothetical protein Tco_1195535 [Tanacetum coccineum]
MPLSDKTILDPVHCFVHELKKEMNDDLEYVNSLEKELDELESEKADFSNIYDLLLEECVSKDVTCSYLHSLSDLNANTELQCLYLHKVKEIVIRPQLKSYQVKKKVVPKLVNEVYKEGSKKTYQRILVFEKTKSVTACNDSSNSRTSNVNAVCAECGKCVFNSNHDACVSRYLKDVNARTKKPHVVPISASKPKRKANKSVATPHKKTVASDTTIQKSKSYYKKLYEDTNQEWKWWIARDGITNIVQLILFIVDSGCTKHMTGNLKLLCNFVEKFLGTVRFGNDQFAPILGYGDGIEPRTDFNKVNRPPMERARIFHFERRDATLSMTSFQASARVIMSPTLVPK